MLSFVTIFFCFVIPIPNATKTEKKRKKSPRRTTTACPTAGHPESISLRACLQLVIRVSRLYSYFMYFRWLD